MSSILISDILFLEFLGVGLKGRFLEGWIQQVPRRVSILIGGEGKGGGSPNRI